MVDNINLAPIVLFVYNRPWHTEQTVKALQKNELAKESELFIYSDAAKNEEQRESVDEIRNYLKKINGFKKVTVIKREKNWGLANSIIDGVTKIVNEYGKIIVLEDDLVTSPYFLKFMNDSLMYYKDEKMVMAISGYSYPIIRQNCSQINETYFLRITSSWSWATWSDSWKYFERNIEKAISEFSSAEIHSFDIDGSYNYWQQVLSNENKTIYTWAIFWYASIFKRNGLTLFPAFSMTQNIGFDGTGIHCGISSQFDTMLNNTPIKNFENNISENSIAFTKLKHFYKEIKPNWIKKVFIFIKRLVF